MISNNHTDVQELNVLKSNIDEGGLCSLCGNKAECKCDRCGDFYCSELCQRKDWQNHRFICFPMPKLVKVGKLSYSKNCDPVAGSQNQLNLQQSKNLNFPKKGSCVLLTSFKSTNRCYIRSTMPSIVKEYNKILTEIDEFGRTAHALSDYPKNNSYALALRDGKWCRAKILLQKNKHRHEIFFVDFGNTSKRYFKELRIISPYLENLPYFIHLVQLKGTPNFPIEQNMFSMLSKYINKEYKVEYNEADQEECNVELFSWGTTILLNSLINEICTNYKYSEKSSVVSASSNSNLQKKEETNKKMPKEKSSAQHINGNETSRVENCKNEINEVKTSDGHRSSSANLFDNKKKSVTAASAIPRQIQNPCLKPPFAIIPLSENDRNCKAIIMDTSYIARGYIGCLLEKYYENLVEITKFLKEYNAGDEPYAPRLNEYCLAYFENEWYRAKVLELLPGDKFLVVYIDFLNEMKLSSESIRRYPMSLNMPCYTTLCSIDGLPEDKADEVSDFMELNYGDYNALEIDSVRIEEDIPYIKSNELLNKMRDAKIL